METKIILADASRPVPPPITETLATVQTPYPFPNCTTAIWSKSTPSRC
ncbi:hypothetical protein QE385_000278 [Sphingomonas sp. SORGH_AS 950]|nr:hypothetical protein [Sphingomonas sp. SORGH_AS_0950]MDQ1155951.1 hypothetical protein [Sphingomonas sp. SORGH_AS_0950]